LTDLLYQNEICQFYDWLETNSVGTSCICLWGALAHTWYKAGCPVEFAVAISTLETKTNLKRSAIYIARNKLRQVGRISFRDRGGNQSSAYTLVSFKRTQTPCVHLTDTNPNTGPDTDPNTGPNTGPDHYNNDNNNMNMDYVVVVNNVSDKRTQVTTQASCVHLTDTNPDTSINAALYYERHFGLLNPKAIEELRDFAAQGIEDALVYKAIDCSFEYGARNWVYAKSILDKCVREQVFTLEEFCKKEERRKVEKALKHGKEGADGNNTGYSGAVNGTSEKHKRPRYGNVVE